MTDDLWCVPGRRLYHAEGGLGALGWFGGQVLSMVGGTTFARNQDGVWRFEAWKDMAGLGQGRALAKALIKERHPQPTRGHWSPHHIIPAFDTTKGGDRPQRIGYACRIRPHSADNGVWVPTALHQKMHTNKYCRWFYDTLHPALMNANGACNYAKAKTILDQMRQTIEYDAALGTFPEAQ